MTDILNKEIGYNFFDDPKMKIKLNRHEKREVIKSQISKPELRKEVKRIFQQANRRIQNIEKAGVMSPAVSSLGKDTPRFSKFAISKCEDWDDIKKEYTKAVNFLQQPTSTVQGSREFERVLRNNLGIKKELFDYIKPYVQEQFNIIGGQLLNAIEYKELMELYYDETTSTISRLIEDDSINATDELKRLLVKQLEDLKMKWTSKTGDTIETSFFVK